ncbi:glutamate carboxypeptidase [Fodinibius salinus]|uniref:Glutamate carboxypeptidase n=1 Tax=Fodinibius salinus TaxID=860790 RepID=A0A5D3YKI3_9BACT|nr:M20 family metallopeptidase [Fodinibius salinus]TYP93995.1 glutamate carboxypeptidase [Fodinibius salinus]
MTELGRELHNFFVEKKADFIDLLQSLVEQETPSNEPSSFTEILEIVSRNFENLDFDVEYREGEETAGQLLCKPGDFNSQAPTQLLVGHIDTVWDIGTLDEMPFTVEGNEAAGPGIFDMKAGICMMIFAMKAIRELEKQPHIQPVFLITTDEEIGSGESKNLIIEQAKQAERTFVLEPSLGTEGKIKTERKGIGQFEITIKGQPSHAGLDPEKGVSAIVGLSNVVQQLVDLNAPEKGISVNVGTIEGGERANVVAAKSKAVVDVRVPTKKDGEEIKKKIYNIEPDLEGVEITVSGDISRPPLEKEEANAKLWEITKSLGAELDLDLQEGKSGGGSDGNFTNLYSPTIDGLGAVGEGAHAYHEKILVEETLKRAELLTLLLLYPSLED